MLIVFYHLSQPVQKPLSIIQIPGVLSIFASFALFWVKTKILHLQYGKYRQGSNPTVIIEVVSKWSEGNDYSRKLMYYRQVPSLKEFVLINSFEKFQVDIFRRNDENTWTLQTYYNLEDSLVLQSVGISILLADIYENVTFEPLEEPEGLIE